MALKTLSIKDFTGGRNSKAASAMLADNESLDQWNTWCENNALVKRRAWTTIDSTILGEACDILKMCVTNLGANGAKRLVMMGRKGSTTASASRLAYTDNGTSLANCEASPTAFSGASIPFMGMFMGKLYVSDGVNSVVSYDGTTVSTIAGFPKYSKCAVHKNYVFAAKGRILYWSTINDCETAWPVNNFNTINSDAGDRIIAIKSTGNGLLIFMQHSMYLLVGDIFDPIEAQYYLQKIDTPSNFNFLFGQTIVTHQGVLKFLTVDGFYAYTGGTQIIKISDPIQPDIDTLLSTAVYNTTSDLELPDSFPKSYVWKNSMYCSVMVSTSRRIIVQDERGKWWWFVDNSYAASPLEAVSCNLGAGEKLFGGLPGYSFFMTLDTGYNLAPPTGAATALISYWISKDFNLPNESRFMYADIFLKKQAAVATLGTLILSISIDGGTFIDFNIDMMNGVGTILKKRIPIMRIGRSIRVKVYNAELGVTYEVYQISVVYEPTTAMR
jgi:hypothetical protein